MTKPSQKLDVAYNAATQPELPERTPSKKKTALLSPIYSCACAVIALVPGHKKLAQSTKEQQLHMVSDDQAFTLGLPRMKQIFTVTFILALFFALQGTSDALAKGPAGVASGVHNLSGTAPGGSGGYATDESEICVFCHTPHAASSTGPLWNKSNPAGPFTHYTTDTPELADPNRVLSDQSKLCMSCHDGISSINSVINLPNSRTLPIETLMTGDPNMTIIPGFGAVNPVLDTDLSNDHPISFSYDNVLTHYTNFGLTGLDTVANAVADGVRFFGSSNYMECSTCHDPHVNYSASGDVAYTPFLITPNAGSNLCLACHLK